MRARERGGPLPAGFATIWSAVAIDVIGFGIVLPILPIYAKRFHATSLQAALLLAAFSAAGFVFSPVWGRLSDRFGRKPILLVALAGTAAGSLMTGLAGGLPLLFAGRLVDGASGASVAVAQAAAGDLATPEQRPRLFGLLGAAFGVGFVAGPAIGALAALGGPRVPFLIAAGLAGVNTVVAAVRLPETRSGAEARPIAAGRWRTPGVVTLVVVAFSAMTAFSGFEATFSLFGQKHLGLTIGSTAAVFTLVGLLIVAVQGGAVGAVVGRFGEMPTLAAGLALNAVGLALLAVSTSWALAAPSLVLLTTGQGLVQTTMASALSARAPHGMRGRVLGAQQSASTLARIAGPAVGGALLGAHASGAPYWLGGGLTLACVVAVVVTKHETETSDP
jgi:DHA1 family tetracycline resistance protein-like MFS transporter